MIVNLNDNESSEYIIKNCLRNYSHDEAKAIVEYMERFEDCSNFDVIKYLNNSEVRVYDTQNIEELKNELMSEFDENTIEDDIIFYKCNYSDKIVVDIY